MATRIQFRRDTAANWTSANPTLAQGEFGLETDTDNFKIGDGTTAWNSLGYGGLVGPPGYRLVGVRTVTGTTDTLTSADVGYLVRTTNASPVTITIPDDEFQANDIIYFEQGGAGQITFANGTGFTHRTALTSVTRAQYSPAALIFTAVDAALLAGDLESP